MIKGITSVNNIFHCSIFAQETGIDHCREVMLFINVIDFNKIKTENQLPTFHGDIISILLELLHYTIVRKIQMKSTLSTFALLFFHWPGNFKGCTSVCTHERDCK